MTGGRTWVARLHELNRHEPPALRPYLTGLPALRPGSWRDAVTLVYRKHRYRPVRVGGLLALFVFLAGLPLCGCRGVTPQTQADRATVGGHLVSSNAAPEVFEAWGRLVKAHDEAAKLSAVTEIVKPVVDWAIQLGLSVVSGYVIGAVEPEPASGGT